MIAQIRETIVEKKKWLTEDELMQIIAIAESTPGPIAINMATFVGYKKGKFLGSLFSTLGVILPSLAIIFTVSLFLEQFMANNYVKYAFVGIKCAVAFLILKAGMGMLIKLKKKPLPLITFGVVLVILILFELFAITFSSIFLILIGGTVGIVAYALINSNKGELVTKEIQNHSTQAQEEPQIDEQEVEQ